MSEQSNQENWQALHVSLRDALQREIYLTRELLSNMHQEEVSLMLNDAGSLHQILQQRSEMLEKLSALRLHRQETTDKIEKIASANHKHPSLEEIIPTTDEMSTEILSLTDQLMALTEKIHRQYTQNQRLTEHPDHYPIKQPSPETRAKRKASLA